MTLDELRLKRLESMMLEINEDKEEVLQYNKELESAEKEIDQGSYYSQTEAAKKISEWS